MLRVIHKFIALIMAIVVLFTTMSFTVDMHYCGDTLVDFSFVQDVKTCGMEKVEPAKCCSNSMISKKSCCSDEQLIVRGQVNLMQDFSQLTFEQQKFVVSFAYSYISLFEGTASKKISFIDHLPPFIRRDLQVLHQTFLI